MSDPGAASRAVDANELLRYLLGDVPDQLDPARQVAMAPSRSAYPSSPSRSHGIEEIYSFDEPVERAGLRRVSPAARST